MPGSRSTRSQQLRRLSRISQVIIIQHGLRVQLFFISMQGFISEMRRPLRANSVLMWSICRSGNSQGNGIQHRVGRGVYPPCHSLWCFLHSFLGKGSSQKPSDKELAHHIGCVTNNCNCCKAPTSCRSAKYQMAECYHLSHAVHLKRTGLAVLGHNPCNCMFMTGSYAF